MIEEARNNFLGKSGTRYNCAQAVIKAYAELFGLPAGTVEAHAGFGGGNAPHGYCGALYAALYILALRDSGNSQKCKDFFRGHSGALTCREIRSGQKITCLSCVEKAAEFLKKEF
ncbi:MAG: C-GCAxxG-C-C family (seleno)protein [Candidatus Omnitrophota bacterium]|jgi:hypothetical protein|nr:C-GCAxxG-C-C family (seleno)protein [Candidatus Omnitrophota bacterium]MDD5525973.1 C-GCAxxG-C-C family (seleno)protein [Candidatus Omnitrophota bacterium]